MSIENRYPPFRIIRYEQPTDAQLKKTAIHSTAQLSEIVLAGQREFHKCIEENGIESSTTRMHAQLLYDLVVVMKARATLN